MLSGKLTVTGKDTIIIELENRPPSKIEIWFEEDENCPIPCNPSHHHKLNWQVHRKHHEKKGHIFCIMVRWEVEGVRNIHWRVHH